MIGGCDLYTTKAAGTDKKLYKTIDRSLESQYESLLRLSASLSPPQATSAASSLNLSRSSPFGPLSQISSRRTFAYLIATLNASHPDYDFSHLLRPTDFRRERSLKSVMGTLDTTLYNLRPRGGTTATAPLAPNSSSSASTATAATMPSTQLWSPRMWSLIDKEMGLRECSIYCYAPEEDPYDGEEGAIWSFNYFFFNKARKRVCYLYLRGLSVMSHVQPAVGGAMTKRGVGVGTEGGLGEGRRGSSGAGKRARYWLGDRVGEGVEAGWDDEEDDWDVGGDEVLGGGWEDEEVDVEGVVVDDGDEVMGFEVDDEDDEGEEEERERRKSVMRGMSEDVVETMEV